MAYCRVRLYSPKAIGVSILFLLLVLLLALCAATVLLSGAFLWYETAQRQPDLLESRFAAGRLLFAAGWLGEETLLLFLTVLLRPLGWLRNREADPLPSVHSPVLLLHGLFHNRSCWWWIARQLRRRGVQVYAVNLHLWHTPEAAVAIVAAKVEELLAGGASAVDLVGHSMGGLVARQYLQEHGGKKIRRCILLGVPNEGSRLASFALSPTGKLLLPASTYLQQLNAAPFPVGVRCTTVYSRHDNLVIPWQSGRLDGARNLEINGVGHTALLYHPAAINLIIEELQRKPMKTLEVNSTRQVEMIDVSAEVHRAIALSGIRTGVALLFVPHTTAAVTINENADPDVVRDMVMEINKIVPFDDRYRHGEGNSAAHVKSSLVGASETLIVEERRAGARHLAGDLLLRVRRPAPPPAARASGRRLMSIVSVPAAGRLSAGNECEPPSSRCSRRSAAWRLSSGRGRRCWSNRTCWPANRRRRRSPPIPRSSARSSCWRRRPAAWSASAIRRGSARRRAWPANAASCRWSRRPARAFAPFVESVPVSVHEGTFHQLEVAREILDAEVIINLPKLKTHQMMGLYRRGQEPVRARGRDAQGRACTCRPAPTRRSSP